MKTSKTKTKKKTSVYKTVEINHYEITLVLDTGNLIYKKFSNKEDLLDFLKNTASNPNAIRKIIAPRRGRKLMASQQVRSEKQ